MKKVQPEIMLTQPMFYARYGLAPHKQKQARDALKIKLASDTVQGRRQKIYTSFEQIDKVLKHFGMIRIARGVEEIVAKIVRSS